MAMVSDYVAMLFALWILLLHDMCVLLPYACLSICMRVHVCAHVHVCVCAHVHVCACVCMCQDSGFLEVSSIRNIFPTTCCRLVKDETSSRPSHFVHASLPFVPSLLASFA